MFRRILSLPLPREETMYLGAFSVSLAVKNIAESKAFYEKLGFEVSGGEQAQRWLIMKNGTTLIGLFEGMFEKNLLTFNPGWDQEAKPLPHFADIRDIQRHLRSEGVLIEGEVDESTKGPAHFSITDPDGNVIFLDQHL